MSEFLIHFDWEDPGAARAEELRATWARLELSIDGAVITSVIDRSVRSWREYVVLPLYPLAEWLADNWWSLWNETASLGEPERASFSSRHCLRQAREGFALPNLTIVPAGNWIQLNWAAEQLKQQKITFTQSGSIWMPLGAVKETMADFISKVIARLQQLGIEGTRLQEDWRAINDADNEEEEFCSLVAALGLDPYSLEACYAEQILRVAEHIPRDFVKEFFHAAHPDGDGLRHDLELIDRARTTTQRQTRHLEKLSELKQSTFKWSFPSHEPPWSQGYALARHVRSVLVKDLQDVRGNELLHQLLGVNPDDPAVVDRDCWASARGFVSYVGPNACGSAGFVLSPGAPHSQTFMLGRALGQYLWPDGHDQGLVTMAASGQQKRNRAFAAELLAPAATLRERIHGSTVSEDVLDSLAQELQVSSQLVRRQLENHGIATIAEE